MTDREDLWVVNPAGQRRDGSWVDDTLVERSVEAGLTARAPDAGRFERQRVELVRGPGAWAAVDESFRRRGWTDGLPIVPPATGRVSALIRASRRQPTEVLADVPPLGGLATVEKVAANAVMAGCAPQHFPFVLAAVEAVTDPGFGLVGVQTTDENVTPLIVISAPPGILAGAEINAGMGLLGPGWRGNAAIGRALRLVLQNLGGGWPGAVSFAGVGQPGRYTLCVAEDDAACPWLPLRVDLGFGQDDTVVVAVRAESAINVTGGVPEIVSVMSAASSFFTRTHNGSAAVLLAPHVADRLAQQGRSRRDIAADLAAAARVDPQVWDRSWVRAATAARTADVADEGAVVASDNLLVFVAGGRIPIPQHVFFPGWGFGERWITRRVQPGI